MTTKPFKPAWWSRNPHLQTLWPFLFKQGGSPAYRRERFVLPDNDFIDIDWLDTARGKPTVILLHGLEGGSDSHYIRANSMLLAAAGLRVAVMHFRGCSGELNRLPRGYHSGDTADLSQFVSELLTREPGTPIAAVGFSLGGNVLLKWCGETGTGCPLAFAVAVSVPFDLMVAADSLDSGVSRLYQWWLVKSLKQTTLKKIDKGLLNYEREKIQRLNTFTEFDDMVTAPLHGFQGAMDYYRRCSSRPWLKHIKIPTLLLQAEDDPFLNKCGLPDASELSDTVMFELSGHGGHVGFVNAIPANGRSGWLEARICDYALNRIKEN